MAELMLLGKIKGVRKGIGQDSFRFRVSKPLAVGGVTVNGDLLDAYPGKDVVMHAICDALGRCIGRSSFLTYLDKKFAQWGVTDSREYVKKAVEFVMEAGYKVHNVAISVQAKRPKLEKFTPDMRRAISNILRITENAVGITAIRGDSMAVQALAVVSVVPCN
jgi:2-C-methyl-D-erythritol 2,4-cyclodiphosphate synthase